jgi:hypothetical protein
MYPVYACRILSLPVYVKWGKLASNMTARTLVIISWPYVFSASLARRRRRQGARLASPALWQLPSGNVAWGCAGATTRCVRPREASLGLHAGYPYMGSVSALLTPHRRYCSR